MLISLRVGRTSLIYQTRDARPARASGTKKPVSGMRLPFQLSVHKLRKGLRMAREANGTRSSDDACCIVLNKSVMTMKMTDQRP